MLGRRAAPGTRTRLARGLHPGAWWAWAACLALAASRTTNPLLLLLIASVSGYVVMVRRSRAPWARAYTVFLKLAIVIIALRVVLQVLLGGAGGSHVLVSLPEVPLPDELAGLRLGGDVTAEGLTSAVYEGMKLATVVLCIGAANALASPARLLAGLPTALYEAGVAVTVAMSFAPQAVTSVGRVREARRLRGRSGRGPRAVRDIALPVLEGALERSVDLAAAMDSRGFGRRGDVDPRRRRAGAALTLGGLLTVCASAYGLLDPTAPGLLGVPLLVAGVLAASAGMVVGRSGGRTRYRPDPWHWPEWSVSLAGATAAVALLVADGGLHPSTSPLVAPDLPYAAALAILVALLPAVAAPPAPRPRRAAAALRPSGAVA